MSFMLRDEDIKKIATATAAHISNLISESVSILVEETDSLVKKYIEEMTKLAKINDDTCKQLTKKILEAEYHSGIAFGYKQALETLKEGKNVMTGPN